MHHFYLDFSNCRDEFTKRAKSYGAVRLLEGISYALVQTMEKNSWRKGIPLAIHYVGLEELPLGSERKFTPVDIPSHWRIKKWSTDWAE